MYMRDLNQFMDITLHADSLNPDSGKPSEDTMFIISKNSLNNFLDQMTLFKMADEISWNLIECKIVKATTLLSWKNQELLIHQSVCMTAFLHQ